METVELEGFMAEMAEFRERLDDWEQRQLDAMVAVVFGLETVEDVSGQEAALMDPPVAWDPSLQDRLLAFADRLHSFREELSAPRRVYLDSMLMEVCRDELIGLLNEGVGDDEDDAVYGTIMGDRRWWEDYTPEQIDEMLWENPDLSTEELEAARKAWKEIDLGQRVGLLA
jgi:hypothetical protein